MAQLSISFFLFITLLVGSWGHLEKEQQKQHYHWKPLVEIDDATFEKSFLPSYVNFDKDFFEQEKHISDQCKADLLRALEALHTRQNWAVQLFNSWGKLPTSGLTSGTMTDFGDYGQCLQVPSAHYCLLEFSFPMPRKPASHNYFHSSNVLPSREQFENLRNNLSTSYRDTNESLYRKMETNAAMFHYLDLRLGICLPESCRINEVEGYAKNSKFRCTELLVSEYTFYRFLINFIYF